MNTQCYGLELQFMSEIKKKHEFAMCFIAVIYLLIIEMLISPED